MADSKIPLADSIIGLAISEVARLKGSGADISIALGHGPTRHSTATNPSKRAKDRHLLSEMTC